MKRLLCTLLGRHDPQGVDPETVAATASTICKRCGCTVFVVDLPPPEGTAF